jgi:N-methylhydantoinase A
VASALGLLVAPARVDRVATVGIRLDRGEIGRLEAAFRRLEDEARAVLADTGLELAAVTMQRLADGRFMGQGFDLAVALPPGPYPDTPAMAKELEAAFESAYRDKFALTPPAVPIEFINVRVAARAPVAGSDVVVRGRPGDGAVADYSVLPTAIFTDPELAGVGLTQMEAEERGYEAEAVVHPLSVVEEEGSTLVVPPGATARVAASSNIVMTLAP